MSDVKIVEDLQYSYELAKSKNGTGMWSDYFAVRIIERLSIAEGRVKELEAESDVNPSQSTYSYETVKGLVKWRDERIAELEQSAQVREAEMEQNRELEKLLIIEKDQFRKEIAALRKQVERLSAPVSDSEITPAAQSFTRTVYTADLRAFGNALITQRKDAAQKEGNDGK